VNRVPFTTVPDAGLTVWVVVPLRGAAIATLFSHFAIYEMVMVPTFPRVVNPNVANSAAVRDRP
jgi:hypothetical protein